MLGGIEKFAREGERILLKPNLVVPELPEKCVTTHPAVFKSVAEIFQAAGARLFYGDSPAVGNVNRAAAKCGLRPVAQELGIELADFKTGREVFYKEGRQNRKFVLARGVIESDGIVSLPKLKPHGLEKITGCLKNQFGCIPGVLKGEYHVKLPDPTDFAKMLVDLNGLVNPRLYVMDAVMAMEGNGPRGGTPRKMGLLLFSTDPVALDATVCRLIHLNPEIVPTIRFGVEFGAGTSRPGDIELLGDGFKTFESPDFQLDRSPVKPFEGKWLQSFINRRLVPRPSIVETRCVCCGACVNMCPAAPKAVNWLDGKPDRPPVTIYKNCIRCYCCQEVCPESAIELEVPRLRRLLNRIIQPLTAPHQTP